jgi:Co/Zn/Cd efflux system component
MEGALLEYGVLGIAVLGLGFAVVALWRRYNKVQDDRFEDHKIMLETSKDMIRSVEKLTDTMAVLADRVERSGGK